MITVSGETHDEWLKRNGPDWYRKRQEIIESGFAKTKRGVDYLAKADRLKKIERGE